MANNYSDYSKVNATPTARTTPAKTTKTTRTTSATPSTAARKNDLQQIRDRVQKSRDINTAAQSVKAAKNTAAIAISVKGGSVSKMA